MIIQQIDSKYHKEYMECIKYIKKHFIGVMKKSDISIKEKLKMFSCGIMPEIYTKAVIKKRYQALQKDLME